MQQNRKIALLLATITAIIYGVSFTVAKDVMPAYVKPYGFIFLRVLGASILFWLTSFFFKKEKINIKDFSRIFIASIFGVALNMLTFFKGLSMTTPISGAVIMVTTPILVLTFSGLFLNEKTSAKKITGIIVGMIGAIILISFGKKVHEGQNEILGNFLVFINAASYAIYLILVKKLTQKYHPIHLAKWLYTFGLLLVLPFSIKQVFGINPSEFSEIIWLKIGFIVFFTTFITYLFNLIAITRLKPTTVSIFIYLQPVFATIYALFTNSDSLNSIKIIATLFIFVGVYLVTKPDDNTVKT
jgi:drug/metabolite transporter (DMT)-like permease